MSSGLFTANNDMYVFLVILIAGLVTNALRFVPFLVFGKNKTTPGYVSWLGEVLPYAIMAMLCVYCLKSVNFSGVSAWAPSAIAVAIVVALQAWRKNSLLSIAAGTVCYMFLIQVVF